MNCKQKTQLNFDVAFDDSSCTHYPKFQLSSILRNLSSPISKTLGFDKKHVPEYVEMNARDVCHARDTLGGIISRGPIRTSIEFHSSSQTFSLNVTKYFKTNDTKHIKY